MMVGKSLCIICLSIWGLTSAGCVSSKDWGGMLSDQDSAEKVVRDDYQKKLEQKLALVEREKAQAQARERAAAAAQAEQRQQEAVPAPGETRAASTGQPSSEGLASGSAAEERGPKELEMEARRRPAYPVDAHYLADRLQSYEQKMAGWNQLAGSLVSLGMGGVWPEGWHDCVQQIEMVIFSYRRLREEGVGAEDSSGPWALFAKDLRYIESGCDQLLAQTNVEFRETLAGYSELADEQAKNLLKQLLDQGRFAAAVEAYQNFVRLRGAEAVDLEMKGLYSAALRRTGRLTEAAAALKEMVAREKAGGGMVAAVFDHQIEYADLLLATGEIAEAAAVYGELAAELGLFAQRRDWVRGQLQLLARQDSPVLGDYQEFLRTYLRAGDGQLSADLAQGLQKIKQGGEPVFITSATILQQKAEELAEERVSRQLSLANELLHDQEFDQARALVEQLLDEAPQSLRSTLLRMKDEIALAAHQENEAQRQLTEQTQAAQWEKAVKFLERKDYDAAMTIFTQLLNTEYEAEAQAKLAETANLAAAEMRRRAAALFVKARKAPGKAERKEILVESRDTLLELIERYPGVDILDKVRQNLQVLEGELEKLESEPAAAPIVDEAGDV